MDEKMGPELIGFLQKRKTSALEAKSEGNRLFAAKAYHEAINAYSVPLQTMMLEFIIKCDVMLPAINSVIVSEIYDILGSVMADPHSYCHYWYIPKGYKCWFIIT